jgi:signal transduction histidine kinase
VVFGILLTAATEGAAGRGKVTIQFRRGANEEVTVKIYTGAELPPPLVDRIFEHHHEPAPPQDTPGASGFSLAHDLIWLHGGRITVTSHPGEGAVFVVTLPPAQSGLKAQTKTANT